MEGSRNTPLDEMAMVRQLLPEPPPPTAFVSARAWRLLDKRMHGRVVRLRRERLGARRLGPMAIGAAAVAAAAAITVNALVPGGTHAGPANTGAGPGAALTGRPAGAFLLTVAKKAAQQATGRYWCTVVVQGTRGLIGAGDKEIPAPWVDGATHAPASAPAGYRYAIFARYRSGDCFERPRPGWPGGTVGGDVQSLGARPASPADFAAWRRDGSPDHWQAWYSDQIVSAHPGPRQWNGPKTGGGGHALWWESPSLPADPAKLEAVLVAHIPGPTDPWVKQLEHENGMSYRQVRNLMLFGNARAVMAGAVTPAVHAAAYQVLAGITGIQMKAGMRDPEQRVGTAVWFGRPGSIPGEYIVVDPATGRLLADVELARTQIEGAPPGTILTYTAYLSAHWTNHPPKGYLKYLHAHGPIPSPSSKG